MKERGVGIKQGVTQLQSLINKPWGDRGWLARPEIKGGRRSQSMCFFGTGARS